MLRPTLVISVPPLSIESAPPSPTLLFVVNDADYSESDIFAVVDKVRVLQADEEVDHQRGE